MSLILESHLTAFDVSMPTAGAMKSFEFEAMGNWDCRGKCETLTFSSLVLETNLTNLFIHRISPPVRYSISLGFCGPSYAGFVLTRHCNSNTFHPPSFAIFLDPSGKFIVEDWKMVTSILWGLKWHLISGYEDHILKKVDQKRQQKHGKDVHVVNESSNRRAFSMSHLWGGIITK